MEIEEQFLQTIVFWKRRLERLLIMECLKDIIMIMLV